jgi:hypothetical protein
VVAWPRQSSLPWVCLRFEAPPTWIARLRHLFPPGARQPICTPKHWPDYSDTPKHWVGHHQSQSQIILRLTVSRPVCTAIRPPSGTRDKLFFLFHVSNLKKSEMFLYGAPSLTRGRVYIFSVVTPQSEPHGTCTNNLLSHAELRSPPLYSPGAEWPSYFPRYWVLFSPPLTNRRHNVEVFSATTKAPTES